MDKETITMYKSVYKVQAPGCEPAFFSYANLPDDLRIVYRIGEQVEGKHGPMFMFPKIQYARNFVAEYRGEFDEYAILECEVDPDDVLDVDDDFYIISVGGNRRMGRRELAWEMKELWQAYFERGNFPPRKPDLHYFKPPVGTQLVTKCTPVRIVED